MVDGTFKITASSLGRATHVIVKVVGEPFKPKEKEEIPTGTVSTRDLPSGKSDTSFQQRQSGNPRQPECGYQHSQIAEPALRQRNSFFAGV